MNKGIKRREVPALAEIHRFSDQKRRILTTSEYTPHLTSTVSHTSLSNAFCAPHCYPPGIYLGRKEIRCVSVYPGFKAKKVIKQVWEYETRHGLSSI